MSHPTARALAGLVAAGVLLAGCSSDPSPDGAIGPSASPSMSAEGEPSVSASPSSTLTAEEQQAVEEATKVVLAYRQTITDLFSGASTRLNDLDSVAAGDEALDKGLAELQQSLSEGWRSEPTGVKLDLISAEPISVHLGNGRDEVVIRACIDSTAVIGVSPDGVRTSGTREASEYTVTRTTYLPDPGWAVTRTKVARDPEARKC
jgi:hypothetical protein